jgi:hypothetical protein
VSISERQAEVTPLAVLAPPGRGHQVLDLSNNSVALLPTTSLTSANLSHLYLAANPIIAATPTQVRGRGGGGGWLTRGLIRVC